MAEPIFVLDDVGVVLGGKTLLTGISFSVDPGEYVTISGPSGSGKSTLLRVLATLLTPTSGTVTFAGRLQSTYEKTAYRRRVSYCYQQPSLFGDTVRDNLTFPFHIRHEHATDAQLTAALATMQLSAEMLDKPIIELSGGEKQRVALARNLLFTPQVLLLDEVTTGLDADTKTTVHRVIEDYHRRGTTVIAVTHDEGEIAVAHRLLTIEAGRLAVTAA
ncbi:ABC transporter ATP-binding protein [Schleiferilactobacillus shenzhenensis]|uniref:YbbL n=1 Tax=Schleiferilactobacillus shenzhenensis LY-73 TaxID=1231336 RepID=U4TMY7_9LACO|nr:ATP-binding cassette domain-containing protein [Schleiferilactobacillus shenzhenensis]ERL65584.1 YbbL [Schleiferilactobacillus shenzhenensis LY-73]